MAGPTRSAYNRRRLALLITLSGRVSGLVYFLALPAWQAFQTAVGFHTLLAFLSIMSSAALLSHYSLDKRASKIVLQSAFLFSGIQNIGAAVLVHYETDYVQLTSSPGWMLGDMAYVALFGVLILISVFLRRRGTEIRRPVWVVLALAVISLLAIGFIFYVLTPALPESGLVYLGLGLGLTASTTITLSGVVWSRMPGSSRDFEVEFMVAGFAIFGLSWIPSFASLVAPSLIWTLGFEMRTVGLFVLLVALEIPYLKRIGMSGRNAYLFTSGLPMLAFLPVILTVFAEAFAPGSVFVSPELYQLAHFGAASISAVMAYLIMSYSKQRLEWNRTPTIALFLVWSGVEIWLLAYTYIPQWWLTGEVLIPYIVGSFLTILLLPIAVRWAQDPKWAQRKQMPART
ncbi:MAG: hypothetical protein ACFFCK_09095, partial [Promethearchaeota archaeon]